MGSFFWCMNEKRTPVCLVSCFQSNWQSLLRWIRHVDSLCGEWCLVVVSAVVPASSLTLFRYVIFAFLPQRQQKQTWFLCCFRHFPDYGRLCHTSTRDSLDNGHPLGSPYCCPLIVPIIAIWSKGFESTLVRVTQILINSCVWAWAAGVLEPVNSCYPIVINVTFTNMICST